MEMKVKKIRKRAEERNEEKVGGRNEDSSKETKTGS
jgi:hypothetical protein